MSLMPFMDFVLYEESWELFLEKEEAKEFKDYKVIRQVKKLLKEEGYLEFDDYFFYNFALPKKALLSKHNTSKKRVVYIYPEKHRLVLKLLAFYLLKKYNHIFCTNSLAYTEGRSVKTAFRLIEEYGITNKDIIYKADFSDYFNSIDIDILKKKLTKFINDSDLYHFIMLILREKRVKFKGSIIEEENKGVMAGSPISGILANIFMHDVDLLMQKKGHKYIRYADDVLIVGEEAFNFFTKEIEKINVFLNPKKTQIFNKGTGITFLGFKHVNNIIDLSDDAVAKMKSRFKRRAKWYRIWMKKNNVKKEVALRDYIKKINFKLFSDQDDSINWSRWYMPNINTTKSIKYLEDYFINCIRYLDSGTWKRGKKYYRLSYKDIKDLGYKSLVNEYYKIRRKNKN